MDTGSRKFRRSIWAKGMAWLVVFAGLASLLYGLASADSFRYGVGNMNYRQSKAYSAELDAIRAELAPLGQYESREAIERGDYVLSECAGAIEEINRQIDGQLTQAEQDYHDALEAQKSGTLAQGEVQEQYYLAPSDMVEFVVEDPEREYSEQVNLLEETRQKRLEQLYQETLAGQLARYDLAATRADSLQGKYTFTVLGENGLFVGNEGVDSLQRYVEKYGAVPELREGDCVIQIDMTEEYFVQQESAYMAERERALGGLSFLAAGIAAILFGAVYLIAVAGRVSGDDALHLLAIDRFCPDITLLAVVLVETLLGFLGLLFVGDTGFPLVDLRQYFICGMMMCAMAVLAIGWMLTASRQCKAGMLWSNTMISRVLRLLKRGWGYLRRCFAPRSLPVRYWGIAIPVILCCIALSFTFPLSLVLVPVILLAVFGMHGKFFSAMERIKEGAARIRGGELDFRIDSTDAAGLEDLIGDINNVAEGLSAAVEGEVKAERLKTELITNVSHDIKTPLTSIITYVDLLQKQDLPGPARDYVDVLARKSQRLKALTEDLFEAAKAASGTLPVHMERVDLCALIRQGMGELDDRIIQSGLTIRTNFCEESLVNADGRLLWRILENMFSNALKYAMPASRVYLTTRDLGDYIQLEMKNVSARELGIPADELMERFVRGDSSRHSEGSGLGLSIARNLAQLMGGHFGIAIDGDLFKASVTLRRWKEPEELPEAGETKGGNEKAGG